MAFRNKQRALVERLDPDVAFIQECEDPDKYPNEFSDKLFPFRIWSGKNRNKGVAVFSKYEIIIWDKKESNSLEGDFQHINDMLNKYNIESVYHHYFKEDFGKEINPTYFMHKKESKPYHTDYIFSNKNIINNIKRFYIGNVQSDFLSAFLFSSGF